MSYMDMGQNPIFSDKNIQEELEQLLLHGQDSEESRSVSSQLKAASAYTRFSYTQTYGSVREEEDEEKTDLALNSDVQGSLGLFAEATQDLATAGLELALGRHFACVDYCNQAAEKAAQAVNLLRQGHRAMYDHDLRALGAAVGAPAEVQEDMATLTPFHPEAFYAETPPEEADEVVSAAQATEYIQTARRILRWARGIIL